MLRLSVIFLIFFFIHCNSLPAKRYYVSNSSGNDNWDGKSESSAWKSIAKVNDEEFLPGDSILFKKGDVWRETLNIPSSGTAENYITFGYFGTDKHKPKILGSEQASFWEDQGGNIWKSGATFINPYSGSPAEIFFEQLDGNTIWGLHKTDLASLKEEYNWTWLSNYIYVYAATDPGKRYLSVEVPQRSRTIFLHTKEYITIDGFDLKFAKIQNVEGYEVPNGRGFAIKNCHISYVGSRIDRPSVGSYGYNLAVVRSDMLVQNNEIHDGGRRNTSVHIYDYSGMTVSNIIFEGNILYNGYHSTGVGINMDGSRYNNRFENIIIRNNLIYDSPDRNPLVDDLSINEMCSLRAGESGSSIANVEIYNNIWMYPTYQCIELYNDDNVKIYNNVFFDFNHNKSPLGYILHIDISHGCTNVDIKNNIFYGTSDWSITPVNSIYVESTQPVSDIKVDYNLFYQADPNMGIVSIQRTGVKYRTNGDKPWASIQADLGWQLHDPGLLDPLFYSATDLHLQEKSPASKKGINVSLFNGKVLDKDRDSLFYNTPPSIGAYEVNPSYIPPPPPPVEPPIDIPVEPPVDPPTDPPTDPPIGPPVNPINSQNEQIIILYPNPSHNDLTVLREGPSLTYQSLRIIDFGGKIVFQDLLDEGVESKNFPLNLKSGVYIIQVLSDRLIVAATKLIIVK
jgi:hypothetical protein